MSGSFETVQWNGCVHRLDLGMYSAPKECTGMESEPMLTPRENPLYLLRNGVRSHVTSKGTIPSTGGEEEG